MFKIFRKRKDKPALTYGVMQYLSNVVERRQRKIACYLNQRTKDYSKKKWMLILCVLCLLFGGMASFIFYQSMINGKQQNSHKLYPQSISIPSSVLQQGKQWDSLKMLEDFYEHRKDSSMKIHSLKKQVHH